ncbi:4-aminobutyrate aminotransferase [Bifidobacterium italicum]|uniref:4-aminobutyrate aminotransferase n=1 Tax=Bifidobacterium italicum TaxID=1960968 RepID=A0A2A2ELI2_9BIFI|nr:4-aminobutyrate aminotransferase [Bifidobacterium italicum]
MLGPAYRLFYRNPVHLVRGRGARLWDADGTEYLDVYNNVASVGHANPRVVDAMTRQAAALNTHTHYLHENILNYAEDILSTMPEEIDRVMFQCTGDAFWGFERQGIVPDIVTSGKPMANGLPTSLMVARHEVLEPFAGSIPYFNTFGGNPVCMAAAQATLDVTAADTDQAALLGAAEGTPLLCIHRIAADAYGVPCERAVDTYLADRMRFTMHHSGFVRLSATRTQ